jgi:hypothetical protein
MKTEWIVTREELLVIRKAIKTIEKGKVRVPTTGMPVILLTKEREDALKIIKNAVDSLLGPDL